jgi:prepilin-type N-terminal cleavage/methylation domain-containing protein
VSNFSHRRSAFTLTELLVVIAIATMISAMTLTAMYSAQQSANESRTRSIVSKVNDQLLQQWAEIETRRLAYVVIPGAATRQRLFYQRQLMRLEFPDRKSDLFAPVAAGQRTARYRSYLRSLARIYGLPDSTTEDQIIQQVVVQGNRWTPALQHAECLYLILASTRTEDGTALDFFGESEIGDFDGDGMKEIHDSWGNPIFYLRWAPGYVAELGVADATQTADGSAPDGFDPLRADVMWNDNDGLDHFIKPFQLYPLVVSAGRDQAFDIIFDFDMVIDSSGNRGNPVVYAGERGDPANGLTGNNPYVMRCRANPGNSVPDNDCGMSDSNSVSANLRRVLMIGAPWDTDSSSFPNDPESPPIDNFDDNISNQQAQVK